MAAFEVTGPAGLEEHAVAACWEAGTLGLETLRGRSSDFRFHAYFELSRETERQAPAPLLQLPGIRARTVAVPEVDWVERFREGFRAFDVGPFAIVPAWKRDAPPGSIPIAMDPGQAFGTGTHETTRLCLKALDRVGRDVLAAATVLDLGAGSGILSIAAIRLGARRAVAIELDPDAAREARRHAALNGVALAVVNGDLATPLRSGCADLVFANLQARLLIERAGQILAAARPEDCLVLSGLLRSDVDEVESAYSSCEMRRYLEGDWVAIEVRV